MKFNLQSKLGVWALISLLFVGTVPMVGCKTPSQATINKAIGDVENVAGIINTSLVALQADVALFPASDQTAIAPYVTQGLASSALIKSLCASYLSNPSATVLAQISAAFGTLASNGASALINVAQIKDPNSQMIAKGVLAAVATSSAILSAYLATAGVSTPAATTVSLNQMKPYMDRAELARELQVAKNQGLAPRYLTLAQTGL